MYARLVLLWAALASCCRSAPVTVLNEPCDGIGLRLSPHVVPTNYAIIIKPDLEDGSFVGNEKITLNVREVTNTITLHSMVTQITDVSFADASGSETSIRGIFFCKDFETVSIVMEKPLKPGEGLLTLRFRGTLNGNLRGFYRFTNKGVQDLNAKYGAVSQFEPSHARRAFPCFDEPIFKATFELSLITPKSMMALSGMPQIQEEEVADTSGKGVTLKMVSFDKSPIMSTYLVSMAVGKFDFIEGKTRDNVVVRVFTPLARKEDGAFTLDTAIRAITFLEGYFGIKCPLTKVDLLSVPDFANGAMENWGLIIFRETLILTIGNNPSPRTKQMIALSIVHELAHQWFGNLVTITWWSDLWLKEGFASFMHIPALDALFPGWGFGDLIAIETFSSALTMDALNNSHPVVASIKDPKQITALYDAISYHKSAAIVIMANEWMGGETFEKGIHEYLSLYEYKNAESSQLWDCLSKASNKPIGDMMKSWTTLKGFPVIQVSMRGRSEVVLKQEKFSGDGETSEAEKSILWKIPVSYILSTDIGMAYKQKQLFDSKSMSIQLGAELGDGEWVKLNPGRKSYYRVNYDVDILTKMIPSIQKKEMAFTDRLNIIDDLFALVYSGHRNTVDYLKVLGRAFLGEDSFFVWKVIDESIKSILTLLSNVEVLEVKMNTFVRVLYRRIYESIGWETRETANHSEESFRSMIIQRLGLAGDAEVIGEAKKRFIQDVTRKSPIDPNLKSTVYNIVASTGDGEAINTMIKIFKESKTNDEMALIARAIGFTRNETQIKQILDFSLSEHVSLQDTGVFIVSVTSSKIGRKMAWDYFIHNIEELKTRYLGSLMMGVIITSLIEKYASNEKAKEYEDFFNGKPFPGTEQDVSQGLETIRSQAKWLDRDVKPLVEYLSQFSSGSPVAVKQIVSSGPTPGP